MVPEAASSPDLTSTSRARPAARSERSSGSKTVGAAGEGGTNAWRGRPAALPPRTAPHTSHAAAPQGRTPHPAASQLGGAPVDFSHAPHPTTLLLGGHKEGRTRPQGSFRYLQPWCARDRQLQECCLAGPRAPASLLSPGNRDRNRKQGIASRTGPQLWFAVQLTLANQRNPGVCDDPLVWPMY